MIDFKNWTVATWLNVAMLALASLGAAGWWMDLVSNVKIATAVSGGLLWASSLLNLVLNGKATAPAAPEVAPPAPPAA